MLQNTKSIRIGLMAPLTGIVSMYGEEISRAAKIACRQINENGGLLGKELEIIILDDGSLPETALPTANRLIDEFHCSAMIGNLLSNTRAIANHVAEPRKIPYLNFSFYEGSILDRYFFNFAALPNQQIEKMIPYMTKSFGYKIFFAGNNYEWPRGSIDAAKKSLQKIGGETLGEEYLPLGSELSDIQKLLDSVENSGADIFIPYFAGTDQINLLTEFSRRGLKKRMAVVMGHYDEVLVSHLSPEVREGFFSVNTYFMSVDNPENHEFLKKIKEEPDVTGLFPEGNGFLTNFSEGTICCIRAFAKAVETTGTIETEALIEALAHIEINTPQGEVRMDPQTQHAAVNSYLSRCNADGTFSIIKNFGQIFPYLPDRYNHRSLLKYQEPHFVQKSEESLNKTAVAMLSNEGLIVHQNQSFQSIFTKTDIPKNQITDILGLNISFTALKEKIDMNMHWEEIIEYSENQYRIHIEPIKQSDGYILYCNFINKSQTSLTNKFFEIADIAILACDENAKIIQANKEARQLFQYPGDEMIQLDVHLLVPPHLRSFHKTAFNQFVMGKDLEISMGRRGEIIGYKKDGTSFPATATITKFQENGNWTIVVTMQDITIRKKTQEELTWQATHDSLTKLPNRTLIKERIHNALQRTIHTSLEIAVLFIDLDNFKMINDTFGHETGDQLLVQISNLLKEHIRPGDIVGRLSGDEFIILCDRVENRESLKDFILKIQEAFRKPIHLKNQDIFTTASIGVSFGNIHTHNSEDILRESDAAMYVSKQKGGDSWNEFKREILTLTEQKLQIANGLRKAIENDELYLVYQPIISAKSNRIIGLEALLRWKPESGFVSPALFIPIAENTGSILKIGEWVFHEACKTQRKLLEKYGQNAPYLSINVSAKQLDQPDLIDVFQNILFETGAYPEKILLEITETSLMTDSNKNMDTLREFERIGFKLAVDDFGTGYSSLVQLLKMPVSHIKIDRIFVNGLEKSKENKSITEAIIHMAKALNKVVVAEGVETSHQLFALQALGCDLIQGYYFYKPTEIEFIEKAIEEKNQIHLKSVTRVYFSIYVSERTEVCTDSELEKILIQARNENSKKGITGFLIYNDGIFMQILEGEEDEINQLLNKIRKDPRHSNMRIIINKYSDTRLFPNWAMGYWNLIEESLINQNWQKDKYNLLEISQDTMLSYFIFKALSNQH
ncbi:MAG: EAL domain-containing protein [Leptospiraceae bacterium]|nr:EAL domain-containing protein [Leptospiraceae bacterium]MCP5510760.1 EAL domain-containing protein [Leptospiraceae bacterium]